MLPDLSHCSGRYGRLLDEPDTNPDLTNQILEVTLEDDEADIQIERYTHPTF